MEDNQITVEEGIPVTAGVLGDRFRQARERANLSIEDVAVHLRLTCQLVQDIEADNYSNARRHLVFLRGYLRAYAKLVDLPADEVIRTFNAMDVMDIPIRKPSWQTEEAEEFERVERSNWLAFVVLGSVLLLGLMTWWTTQYYDIRQLGAYFSQSTAAFSAKVIPAPQKKKTVSQSAELNQGIASSNAVKSTMDHHIATVTEKKIAPDKKNLALKTVQHAKTKSLQESKVLSERDPAENANPKATKNVEKIDLADSRHAKVAEPALVGSIEADEGGWLDPFSELSEDHDDNMSKAAENKVLSDPLK